MDEHSTVLQVRLLEKAGMSVVHSVTPSQRLSHCWVPLSAIPGGAAPFSVD